MVARERAQLLLITAVLIALTVVGSVMLLNQIHESADVQSQQDRQSLEQTEQLVEQVQSDLRELFLRTGSGKPLPYVDDKDAFAALLEGYNESYRNLSTASQAAATDAVLLDIAESEGNATFQNETNVLPRNQSGGAETIVETSENVTYMSFTFEQGAFDQGEFFEINATGSDTVDVNISETQVEVNEEPVCSYSLSEDGPIELEFIHAEGEVRTDDGSCAAVGLDWGTDPMKFNSNDDVSGTFGMVVESETIDLAEKTDLDRYKREGVDIHPLFAITYVDSQVTYQGNVTLYGGNS